MADINKIKQLREETGVSVGECQKALEEAGGDFEKAKDVLKKWGKEVARKKASRETAQGVIDCYLHPNRKVGALLEQPWIKDASRTIKDLIEGYVAKLGENIVVKKFVKYSI